MESIPVRFSPIYNNLVDPQIESLTTSTTMSDSSLER
uniref:Uncharacterized protein n=1 Tax=Kalanchoe fedtschenkoi TaxID=63787 RepID=A0A7N0UWC4_KALFE